MGVAKFLVNCFKQEPFLEGCGCARLTGRTPRYPPLLPIRPYAKYPGVVIEVLYAQKRKDLAIIAEDYILGSNGDIRAIIGIDVEYRGSKKATLSVWRPGVVQNEVREAELVAEQTLVDQVCPRRWIVIRHNLLIGYIDILANS